MNLVPIKLDKTRNLKMGFKAISIVEDAFNKPMSQVNFELLTIKELATIIYSGLVWEDKELSVDRVLDLIDEHGDMEDISKALAKAIEIGFTRKNVAKAD